MEHCAFAPNGWKWHPKSNCGTDQRLDHVDPVGAHDARVPVDVDLALLARLLQQVVERDERARPPHPGAEGHIHKFSRSHRPRIKLFCSFDCEFLGTFLHTWAEHAKTHIFCQHVSLATLSVLTSGRNMSTHTTYPTQKLVNVDSIGNQSHWMVHSWQISLDPYINSDMFNRPRGSGNQTDDCWCWMFKFRLPNWSTIFWNLITERTCSVQPWAPSHSHRTLWFFVWSWAGLWLWSERRGQASSWSGSGAPCESRPVYIQETGIHQCSAKKSRSRESWLNYDVRKWGSVNSSPLGSPWTSWLYNRHIAPSRPGPLWTCRIGLQCQANTARIWSVEVTRSKQKSAEYEHKTNKFLNQQSESTTNAYFSALHQIRDHNHPVRVQLPQHAPRVDDRALLGACEHVEINTIGDHSTNFAGNHQKVHQKENETATIQCIWYLVVNK